jgi:hypothetical protein
MMLIAIRFLPSAAMQQALFIEIDTEIAERTTQTKIQMRRVSVF